MDLPFLINQRPDARVREALLAHHDERDPIRFAVIGEISPDNRYHETALAVTATRMLTIDLETGACEQTVAFADIDEIRSKRMYGNGMLRVTCKDGTKLDLFRFTFTVAALCDAAIGFAREMAREDADLAEHLGIVEAAYEKQLSVCPKCGRTLAAPGVPCVGCMQKGKLLRWLGGYLRPEAFVLVISVLLSIVTTAIALLPPLLTKQLVDEIIPQRDRRGLALVVILLLSVNVVRYLFAGVRGYMLRITGNRIVARIRREVYEKAQRLPMRFYDKTTTGSVINRISSDTSTLQSFMLRITQEVVVQLFKLVGIVVVMVCMDWRLTFLSLCPVPIVVIGARIFRRRIRPFYRRIWRRSSAVTSMLADTIPGIRVVKSFTNEQGTTEQFSARVEEWRETDSRAGRILSAYPAVVNCLIACGSVLIWSFGGGIVIDALEAGEVGRLTVGLLVSFISYASMFYEPVNFFANLSDSTQNAMASAERIMDILEAEPEHDFGKGNTSADMGGRIEFKNVSFSFDRTKKVLKDVNLTIEPGEVVGIVGTTGSGKSTLVNLLLRYYDHYEGEITVDGVNIRDIDMKYYRGAIGYVQQEPMMFHDTIFNNIAYGDRRFTVDEVIAAADVANAHEFIVRQPDGYDSVLGERGVGLSGGERQRVSIARAMLRDPKLLVFDEATASVDSETEHLIQEAIEKLISGRTTIMIAHRLSTLSRASKIVVVDNGAIIECGTPEELLARKGKYYRLVEIQSMSDQVAKSRREERFS